ncbi:DUF6691 family protein [Maritalea sp.]|jgi:uncharacterized membrane protein YedE/YeeE|uniref:DUF6691 family protein n=1 Tax=Maritalea sp. TaxID=2003361 RepID=UPI0039E3C446
MKLISTFIIGLIFGTGITVGGMANPAKVLNFFDIAGTFDASLLLVMVSALAVTAVGYIFVLKRPHPVFEDVFSLPAAKQIDMPLILGSATFGIGWGITGFCPGGAIPALGLMIPDPLIFVVSMGAGITLAKFLRSKDAFKTTKTHN